MSDCQAPRFVSCEWSCTTCRKRGASKVYRYPGETPTQTKNRFGRETRARCVAGCAFNPIKEPTHV